MDEAAIKQKLVELTEEIIDLPHADSSKPKPSTAEGVYRATSSANPPSADDALDYLRFQVKYLLFDLEATRRENRYLRQMLEMRPRRDEDSEGPGFLK